MVSSEQDVESAAGYWVKALHSVEGIQSIAGQKSPEMLTGWAQNTLKFSSLLPKILSEKIQQGHYPNWVLSQIYSPFSGVSISELNYDPLLLIRAMVLEQLANNSQFSMNNGWVTVTDDRNKQWILITKE